MDLLVSEVVGDFGLAMSHALRIEVLYVDILMSKLLTQGTHESYLDQIQIHFSKAAKTPLIPTAF